MPFSGGSVVGDRTDWSSITDADLDRALRDEVSRLHSAGSARRSQDLPVHAVVAGWKGECAAWRAETWRLVREAAGGSTMPPLGWFGEDAGWWDEAGQARNPQDVDLAALRETQAWADGTCESIAIIELSALPEMDELTESAVRLGLAVVRDAVMAASAAAVLELRELMAAGFVSATRAALDAWYENRGAAPLAVLDEMRRHIEYAAARRHYVREIPAAIENAGATWMTSPSQPGRTLEQLSACMVAVASVGMTIDSLDLSEPE